MCAERGGRSPRSRPACPATHGAPANREQAFLNVLVFSAHLRQTALVTTLVCLYN